MRVDTRQVVVAGVMSAIAILLAIIPVGPNPLGSIPFFLGTAITIMHIPVILGYTCRYCPDCDLLVAHQDEIEHLLAGIFAERDPSVVGNDYLVMGTVERALWRETMKTKQGQLGDQYEQLINECSHAIDKIYIDAETKARASAKDGDIEEVKRLLSEARRKVDPQTVKKLLELQEELTEG